MIKLIMTVAEANVCLDALEARYRHMSANRIVLHQMINFLITDIARESVPETTMDPILPEKTAGGSDKGSGV